MKSQNFQKSTKKWALKYRKSKISILNNCSNELKTVLIKRWANFRMGRQKFAARLEQYLKSNFEKYHLWGINEAANDQKISNFNFSFLNTCSIELKLLLNETTSKITYKKSLRKQKSINTSTWKIMVNLTTFNFNVGQIDHNFLINMVKLTIIFDFI